MHRLRYRNIYLAYYTISFFSKLSSGWQIIAKLSGTESQTSSEVPN
jgi:hypothetical protein